MHLVPELSLKISNESAGFFFSWGTLGIFQETLEQLQWERKGVGGEVGVQWGGGEGG